MTASTTISMANLWQQASGYLDKVVQTQSDAIEQAAKICVDTIKRDGIIHTFGSGHSRAFAMELVHRAGGLAPFSRIELEDLHFLGGWPTERVKSLDLERDQEAGQVLYTLYNILPQDIFLISSQSGANNAIVELALQVKANNHTLIAVTALDHTTKMPSRHTSGKKLYELADLVIDNCGPYGDTLLDLPAGGKVCAISSMTNALIGQLLTAEIARQLLEDGIEPPAFISDNVPGGIERNLRINKRYEGRVRWH